MATVSRSAVLVVLAACHADAADRRTLVALRAACPADQAWTGTACAATGAGAAKVAEGKAALSRQDVDAAKLALEVAAQTGPLDHATNVTLWEQRGIARAYVDDEPGASAAFDMLLALDPGHFLSYTLSPKATFVFEKVRNQPRVVPTLDVSWEHGGKVGDPVPVDVEVVADPKHLLARATLFVRTRGEPAWRATDLALGPERRLLLPPIAATKPVSVELYLRAYDARGNETLVWADPKAPREIPLRYEPPTPWWRRPWVIATAGTILAGAVGITVYELTIAPPNNISGPVSVTR